MTPDPDDLLTPGPWQHRFVAANGCRFHVAVAGRGPLVVLVHGFGGLWWSWRHQLPALADAGLCVAALDLRGVGASDKPPRGYDLATLTADVAGVVRGLGARRAVVIGHGSGAWVSWAMPALQPQVTGAVGVLSMGHPAVMPAAVLRRDARATVLPAGARRVPGVTARWLAGPGLARVRERGWGEGPPDPAASEVYRRALLLPAAARRSLRYARTVPVAGPRQPGRRPARDLRRALRRPVTVPVLQLHGALDPWVSVPAAARSRTRVTGPLTARVIEGAGHFLPEEAPAEVTAALLAWLGDPDLRPPVPDDVPVRTAEPTG